LSPGSVAAVRDAAVTSASAVATATATMPLQRIIGNQKRNGMAELLHMTCLGHMKKTPALAGAFRFKIQ
jgi:hypothetical protein